MGIRGSGPKALKLIAGVLATFVLVCAQADALTFKPKTKAGTTCPITAIADQTTYGVSIPACGASVEMVNASGYLFREPGSGTTGGTLEIPVPPVPIIPLPPVISLPIPLDPGTILGDGTRLAGAKRFPTGSSLPYEFSETTDKIGNAVRIEVTLQLRGGRNPARQWSKKAGGKDCAVKTTRSPRDTIACDASEALR